MIAALLMLGALTDSAQVSQAAFDVKELAEYRLTAPIFQQFAHASRLIGVVIRNDSGFADAPLFTRELAVLGDAPVMASELEARLRNHPALANALRTARITAREYTTFALALVAARLAHGFVKAGVLRTIPPGVAADNVTFVDSHQAEIAAVLTEIGVESPPMQVIHAVETTDVARRCQPAG